MSSYDLDHLIGVAEDFAEHHGDECDHQIAAALRDLKALRVQMEHAPIARVTVWAHLPPSVTMYAPGLPPGEHDLYCEPVSAADQP